MFHIGTSIGFKNIASKIAYDLRLWLDSKPNTQQPFPEQQSKSLDYDHQPPEPHNINSGGESQVIRPSASVGLTASVLAEQNEEEDEIYGEATDETAESDNIKVPTDPTTITPSNKKTTIEAIRTNDSAANPSSLPTELNADTTKSPPTPSNEPTIDPDNSSTNAVASNNASAAYDNKPDSSNIQIGYNNMIASLLRTTTL